MRKLAAVKAIHAATMRIRTDYQLRKRSLLIGSFGTLGWRAAREAEIAFLRQQPLMLPRSAPT
jgi:hypothetical protein